MRIFPPKSETRSSCYGHSWNYRIYEIQGVRIMVTIEQMLMLKERMKTVWKRIMPDANAISVWADSFRDYDFGTVETAVIEYMSKSYYMPTPADIINCIPAAPAPRENQQQNWSPKYETMPDGQQRRVIKCKRCRDTGLITWMNDEMCYVGRPCTCEAAFANYGKAVLARYGLVK